MAVIPAKAGIQVFAVLLVAAFAGCANTPSGLPGALEGRIWDVRDQRFVADDELAAQLRKARYRLLGEVHDHPEHHRLRAGLVEKLGARTEVYFEQFDAQHDTALRAAQLAGADADALALAGHMDASWKWPLHRPLLAASVAAKYPVRAANLSRGHARRIMKAGALEPGDGALAAVLESARWTALQEQELRREILDSHCGALPGEMAPAMVLAQRARDATLALALAQAPGSAVLIAGNGHVRRDAGVPLYLAPGSAVLSVGFLETRPGEADPQAYARGIGGEAAYDYVWFTAPQPRPDPCGAFRKRSPRSPRRAATSLADARLPRLPPLPGWAYP
jgi:uncharacterized iron-regulated protein